jgi:hypothetical protein
MLEWPDQPGRFLPCKTGVTEVGRQMALGFSCFALKLYYMLGLWQTLASSQQAAWIALLKSFQKDEYRLLGRTYQNAFIDPPVVNYLASQVSWRQRLGGLILRPRPLTFVQQVITAETKQAIATLAEIGEVTEQPYRGFLVTSADIKNYLLCLDWTQPWGAGGQASALVVFLKIEAPRFLGPDKAQALADSCVSFFENLADSATGGYFKAKLLERSQLINGAMKVLTALDWLEVPIHYPEKLIDTCLEHLPLPEGCYLVDAIYILYRCLQQTEYKRGEIQVYCIQVLDMIRQHYQPDGGFSYYLSRSQTTYYNTPISRGLTESDIHGTCLLTWALAMIFEILDNHSVSWRVIKP